MDSQKTSRTNRRPLDVLIMAAGLGTRMRSGRAKVLHQLDGRSLVAHVCRAAARLEPRRIYIVVGHQSEEVTASVAKEFGDDKVTFIEQTQQRGTGDAVMAAREALAGAASTVMVLSGDVPLVRPE